MKTKQPNKPAVAAGHELAAQIAWDVLQSGGNAVDAGVAGVMALSVLHSEQVQFGGIAPMLVRPPAGEVFAIDGVGRWPMAIDPEAFVRDHASRIPRGILRTVTPALPAACIEALRRFGTFGFSDLATPAMSLAQNGFPAHQDLSLISKRFQRHYSAQPENADIWLPNGAPIEVGDTFLQPALAATLQRLVDADRQAAAKQGRAAGLEAVRREFYEGDIATTMIRHVENHGGVLSADDLKSHWVEVEAPVSGPVGEGRLYTPGSASQGPSLIQALQIMEQLCKAKPKMDQTEYLGAILRSVELAMADRDRFYGDRDFTDVPFDRLLNPAHAKELTASSGANFAHSNVENTVPSLDTSVIAVLDKDGGLFVATPSDQSHDAPAVPGLGFVMSTRGGQSFVDQKHPACIRPGKRPRASASPFVFKDHDDRLVAGGGPGADLLIQAATQVLAHHLFSDVPLAQAIEAPRVFNLAPPGSSEPHLSFSGKVAVEGTMPKATFTALGELGFGAVWDDPNNVGKPSLCMIEAIATTGQTFAHVDPRRAGGARVGT
ncbi:gamma-glutamyltransferase [Rhodobacteraceae bacterium]|nr:gamma-glutamyltransferase [Paracoccaceae bacterium]